MTKLMTPLILPRGRAMMNRMVLAPMTNMQSGTDGVLSADEFDWLVRRAEGGFGMIMTCASHVQAIGQGWPGQLGIWSDHQVAGLTRLTDAIRSSGSLATIQLHHAGRRAPRNLIDAKPVGTTDDAENGVRALTTGEVDQLIEDFVAGAERAKKAGFDGVSLHAGHGHMIGQFLSSENVVRTDCYGGSFENRSRMLLAIVEGIRSATGPNFQIGVRLSAERYGIPLSESRALTAKLFAEGIVDNVDLSLWSVFKQPEEEAYHSKPLIDWFCDLPRGTAALGVSGKIMSARTAAKCLDQGADFVLIGRAAILHADFPKRVARDHDFESISTPVSENYLRGQAVGPAFVEYLRTGWEDFVSRDHAEPFSATGTR